MIDVTMVKAPSAKMKVTASLIFKEVCRRHTIGIGIRRMIPSNETLSAAVALKSLIESIQWPSLRGCHDLSTGWQPKMSTRTVEMM